MFSIPPLPPWDGMHPIVVHYPIALIIVAPLFVVLALVWKKQARVLLVSGAVLMALAAGGAWLATSTGSAAEDYAERVPGARPVVHEHEELAEAARNFATALAGVLAIGAGFFWMRGENVRRGVFLGAGLVYLIANGAGAIAMASAAHQGGRLVHELGVRARLSESAGGPAPVSEADSTRPLEPNESGDDD